MPLYKRILVPLGDAGDAGILAHVEPLAALTGAEIVLLRVAHYHTRDSKAAEIAESEALLGEVTAQMAARGFDAQAVVGQGEVVETILAKARELEVDLIALATHGHGPLTRAVLGCVSESIRRGSVVPVLTARIDSAALSK
jgi:nucleotide-binding universal stress UspA family protein